MAKGGGRVIERDLGWKALTKEFGKLAKQPHVDVGVRGESGLEPKKDSDGNKSSTVNLVNVATFHEFGTSNGLPERSFIRSTVDDKKNYNQLKTDLMVRLLSLKIKTEKALGILGLTVQKDIRAKIRSNIPPALSPRTIAAKGSSIALIDTGQLIQGISYLVKEGER